jgi:inosine-uridine nucleoside N-ribohydrolase
MNRSRWMRFLVIISLAGVLSAPLGAQKKRKVIIDQDGRGPATTDQQAILLFLQSPEVEPLGITIVSGDQWRDEEVAHTLRMLEIIGRSDVPVVPGAVFPLVNTKAGIARWEKLYGRVVYQGAWNWGAVHEPFVVPPLREGNPTTKPAEEDAAHFLIRMVHKHPHEVTIYAGGPLTNLALAIAIDPQFPALAKELVVMGGSINPGTSNPEFAVAPRREFNFWWDPEAAHMVLCAPWPKITETTVDLSLKTRLTKARIAEIAKSKTPVAQYLAQYANEEYMWDEAAAAMWLDPSLVKKEEDLYVDVDYSHGPGYGNTLTWPAGSQPGLGERLVHVPTELSLEEFYRMFVDRMTRPTPTPPKSAAH